LFAAVEIATSYRVYSVGLERQGASLLRSGRLQSRVDFATEITENPLFSALGVLCALCG